jgi:L-fuconolactonase
MAGVIDAHQHFWDPSTSLYPWMTPDLAPLRRRFSSADLRPLLARTGVERTVLVQTRSSLEETFDFLETAASTDFVAGVVGWVDLTDPGVADVLARVTSSEAGRWLVGIRHQAHDEPDAEWLARPDVINGLRAIRDAGLPFDLVVRPRELPSALTLAQAIPDLALVVDHIGKPEIRAGSSEPWAERMGRLAALPNVACKLSGMVTEADWAGWSVDDLRPYVARVIDWFGPERLMFGSDWPVCILAATYEQVFDAAAALVSDLSAVDRDHIFGGTATGVYGL